MVCMVKEKIVGGYAFYDDEEYKKALNEQQGIAHLQKNTNFDDVQSVLTIYRQLIEKNLFSTPVGYDFLAQLYQLLYESKNLKNATIPPVPVYLGDAKPIQNGVAAVDSQKTKLRMSRMEGESDFQLRQLKKKCKRLQKLVVRMGVALVSLIVGSIVMALILSNSENLNILNYESRLLTKYATWEQQLNDRENQLREEQRKLDVERESMEKERDSSQK